MNNDRFKFRVWDITNNEYRRNSYIWTLNQIGYLTNDSMISLTSFSEEPNFEYIIEQSTGLKDKNGKLIFEGDVVKCDIDYSDDERVLLIREVRYYEEKAGFYLVNINTMDFNSIGFFHNFEIIGNIHDKE